MAIVIDELEIDIKKKGSDASSSLDNLANSFKNLNKVLNSSSKGVSAMERMSASMSALNNAIGRLSTGNVKRVEKLARAMKELSESTKGFKGLGSVGKSVSSIGKAISSNPSDADTSSENGSASGTVGSIKQKVKLWDKLGDSIRNATAEADRGKKTFGKLLSTFGRIAVYRAIRSSIKAIASTLNEGLANAYEFSKLTKGELYQSMNKIASLTYQMKNQLGALFGEVIKAALPLITQIVNAVITMANKLTELFAALRGADVYKVAKEVSIEWDSASASVKKYKNQLLGLDELNNISSGDSSKTTTTADEAFYYASVSENLKGLRENLDKALTDIKSALHWEEGETIFGWALGEGKSLKEFLDNSGFGTFFEEFNNWLRDNEGNQITIFEKANLAGQELHDGLIEKWGEIKQWWSESVSPVFTKEWWKEKFKSIRSGLNSAKIVVGIKQKWDNIKTWWDENIKPKFTKAYWKDKFDTIREGIKSSDILSKIVEKWTGITSWFAKNVKPKFTKEYWKEKWDAIKEGFLNSDNDDGILAKLKRVWNSIVEWWNKNVQPKLDGLKDALSFDFSFKANTSGDGGGHRFANGGIPTNGTLFYAGEAGAEFIGNIGNTSAVANTDQMTDILKSATYAGVTAALQNSNLLGDLVPATADDVYFAIKRANNKNSKMTGSLAW